MSEDAGAGTAEGDAGAAAGAEGAEGTGAAQGSAGAGATPGVADQSAEALLAAAMSSDSGGDEGGSGDDLAKQLAAARAAEKKWKDTALKTEKRANANAEAAKKLADIEEANKTEAQRLADRATAADQRAAKAELKYHRTLAAATYGLPPGLINSISGATEDEINESAETLAASINERVAEQVAAQVASANGGSRGTRPVESMRPGAIPAGAAQGASTNPNDAFRRLLSGEK
jgi:hypothetical protein